MRITGRILRYIGLGLWDALLAYLAVWGFLLVFLGAAAGVSDAPGPRPRL